MRALDVIERCSEVFAIAAGFGMNRKAFFRYDWCRCRSCLAHPLLMSPQCLRWADVGGLRSKQCVSLRLCAACQWLGGDCQWVGLSIRARYTCAQQ